nr:MAG TPA: hypothetical protein [Caudoviricetes sp.]
MLTTGNQDAITRAFLIPYPLTTTIKQCVPNHMFSY